MNGMLNFGDVRPRAAGDLAEALSQALFAHISAEKALKDAIHRVPDYTGQWDNWQFYADEQEARNRTADDLAAAIAALTTGAGEGGE